MKKIITVILIAIIFSSCERELDSMGIAEGEIAFPSILMTGPQYVSVVAGSAGSFSDPGITALLGTDDITSEATTTGTVDMSTPGIYTLTYSVSTTNVLGTESSVSATRYINVTASDISGFDLSGNYLGVGFSSAPSVQTVSQIGAGWYSIGDVLSSGNGIVAFFAQTDATTIVIPDQPGPFGNVNTTSAGASGTITAAGFDWVVFIGCCGNFGPIVWTKQ